VDADGVQLVVIEAGFLQGVVHATIEVSRAVRHRAGRWGFFFFFF
jgi:hypothetical protein